MTDQALVDPKVIYGITAATFFMGATLFGALTYRGSREYRSLLLLATLPSVAMGLAYVLMALDVATVAVTGDREQSLMRFVGYTVVLAALVFVFRRLADLPRRLFGLLVCVFVFTPWAALGSWLVAGVAESLLTALVVVGYLTGSYLLLGPAGRQTESVTRDRRLLFTKLRNLFVICWGALIAQSAVSEQTLGLTDFLVGQITVSYTDAVLAFGIFGLVYGGRAALSGETTAPGSPDNETEETRANPATDD